ncbi:isocitrate/isopropylmalate dehydrogenase family protein [Candidatus Gottesmanbacteria bacterium]|nr:isocitrate/isopropylmalate dehydrogenase family protein [Candidatus Gottesmanbacteria bacterium]
MAKNTYKVCIIKGDGIGPEVISEALKLLISLPLSFQFLEARAGYDCYLKTGKPLPEDTVKKCKETTAILFGAVTTPPNIRNYFSPIVKLRKILALYANVRPFFSLPLSYLRQDINFIIVRENTEDLYIGREKLTLEGAMAERIITKKGSKKIIDFAFKLAKDKKRKKVTVVHKANILRLTDGLFLETAKMIAKDYPQLIMEDMLVDTVAMNLIKKPDEFDVIVTTNMFGDILSDEAAALVGGLGVAAGANLGDRHALFEPVHGSVPKYQGQNRVNPIACFFAVVMMLEFLQEWQYASYIRQSILKVIKNRCITADLGGKATTHEVTQEVIKVLKRDYVYH